MEITEISDRLEIEQLMVRYIEAIDSKDWDLLDSVFTEDAHLDYESSGGPEGKGDYPSIKLWLQNSLAIFPMTQHLIGKSLIEIDGDSATCRTIFSNPMGVPINEEGVYDPAGEQLHIFTVGGWYNDTCIRTESGWRINEKIEEQAYMEGTFPPFE